MIRTISCIKKKYMIKKFYWLKSNSGFSFVELVVSVGLTGMIFYYGANALDTHFKSKQQIKKDQKRDQRSAAHTLFSNKFIDLMNNADISVNYFKVPVEFDIAIGNCGERQEDGGCFMSLNEQGEIGDVNEADIKWPSGKQNINFYKDETIEQNIVILKSKLSNIKFENVDYKSAIRSSAEKRYFVGWKLQNTDVLKAFPVMSRISNRFYFQIPQGSANLITQDENLPVGCNIDDYKKKFFATLKNFGADKQYGEEAQDHNEMFYMYYNVQYPSVYHILKVEKILKCGNTINENDCKEMFKCFTGNPQPTTADIRDKYLITIVDGTGEIKNFLPKIEVAQPWLLDQKKEYPYFPYQTSSLVDGDSVTSTPAPAFGLDVTPVNPTFLLNTFHVHATDPNSSAGSNLRVHMFPIILHKFYLKPNANGSKNLVHKKFISEAGGNEMRLINNLLPDSKVIFARQLGTMRISAFIFDNLAELEP